jgi:hypothetical protein
VKKLLVALPAAVGLLTVLAVPGQAATPTLKLSATTIPAVGATVTVSGTSYLVPPHAEGQQVFGGVYVFFGWVSGGSTWGPAHRNSTSNNGTFPNTYAYPGDGGGASTRDDGSGLVRLVSFTDGGESGGATSFHMDAAGNWTTTLKIPGPTFSSTDPVTGQVKSFDCRTVQCGVYTIGAHGKASATNELFTPVTFATAAVPAPPAATTQAPKPSAAPKATTAAPATSGPAAATAAPVATTEVPATSAAAAPPTSAAASASAPADAQAVNVRNVSNSSNGSSFALIGGLVAAAALAAAAGGWIWRRRSG